MCYFVHIAVPSAHAQMILSWPSSEYCVESCRTHTLAVQFPKRTTVLTVTDQSGHCSCSLFHIGRLEFNEERERSRYQAKGWSNAKIDRAIASRRPSDTPSDAFARRVESVAKTIGQVHICAVDGDDELIRTLPKCQLSLTEYVGSEGIYPIDTIVTIRAV